MRLDFYAIMKWKYIPGIPENQTELCAPGVCVRC